MKKYKTLPKRIINQKKRNETEKEFEQCLKTLQAAYDAIRAMEDLGDVPTDPKQITSKWFNEVLLEKVGGVENLPVPTAKKNEILDMWDDLRKEVRKHITTIQSFFENYGNVQHEVKDGVIVITNLNDILDDVSTMIVPDDAQKHYELWCGVRDAIKELREWEHSKDLKKFPLDQIIKSGVDAELFAEHWCAGTFTKTVFEKSERAEQLREINESMYL